MMANFGRTSFFVSFLSITLVSFSLQIGVEATLDVEISLVRYQNPNSEDCEGSNCEGIGGTCDNLFTFCLRRELTTSCTYGSRSSTTHLEDDDITFTNSILTQIGLSNPIEFRNIAPSSPLVLEVRIEDFDTLSANDLVDTIIINFPRTLNTSTNFSPTTSYQGTCRSTDRSVIELQYKIVSNCPLNRYGSSCNTVCIPRVGQYYCNYLGERVCQGTFTGVDCNQCIPNYFGPNCDCTPTGNLVCNENGDLVCPGNFQAPECTACLPNYYGAGCNIECVPRDDATGHYSCNQDGSRQCLRNFDHPETGCLDCVPNYYGVNCDILCVPESSRFRCNNEGQIVCNGNYIHPNCTDCLPNYYGSTCGTFCVPRDDTTGHYECNPVDGSRVCLRNFAGPLCLDCIENYFSQDCNVFCSPPTARHMCVEPGVVACIGNYQLPDCEQCLPNYYSDTCSVFCQPQANQYDCIPTPPYRQCLGNFASPDCTDCIENFAGTECTECAGNFGGSDCSECVGNFAGPQCTDCSGNFEGRRCTRCKTNYYTSDCSKFCEPTSDQVVCDAAGNLVASDNGQQSGGIGVGGYIGIGIGVVVALPCLVCLLVCMIIGCCGGASCDCCSGVGGCLGECSKGACECCLECIGEVIGGACKC